jgi:hypothetical protein
VRTIAHRLSLPVGEKGSRKTPGGYRSRREWHATSDLAVVNARDRAHSIVEYLSHPEAARAIGSRLSG